MKSHDKAALEPSLLLLCFVFPNQIPTQLNSVPIFFPRDTFLVPLSAFFPLILYFEQEVLIEPCCSWAFLVQINTCGNQELQCSKKNVLNRADSSVQLHCPWEPFPRRVLFITALNNRQFVFLNYSILTLLVTRSMSLKTLNSTRISWLQPRLPPIWHP